MKKYYTLINVKSEEVKTYFFAKDNGENILRDICGVMQALNDFDLLNYRLYESETKREWEEKRKPLEPIFCGNLCFWVKGEEQ